MEKRFPATGSGQFVPARLQIARTARGLKQVDLAEALEVTPPTVNKWEGEGYGHAPDAQSVAALAVALNVASEWFYKPVHSSLEVPFFRSMKGELNRVRDQVASRLKFLEAIHDALLDRVEFPEEDIPDLVADRDFRKFSQEDIESFAQGARDFWALGDGPIEDLMVVIENAGVAVGEDFFGSSKLDGVSAWSSNGRPLMLLGRDKGVGSRRRFDAAHELGHLILHKKVSREDFARNFDVIEEQAMSFASAFLLPASSFAYDIVDTTLDELANKKPKWKVSIAAMIKRLALLHSLSEGHERNLWKYYSARQWRSGEPHEESVPFERPENLKSAVEMVAGDGERDASELLRDIGLHGSDIHELTDADINLLNRPSRQRPRLKLVGRAESGATRPSADND
jgi:Zn-dependent peptidase ImmA (M78 family)/DNA-binding XRE family transcriptional regulator